MSEKRVLLKGLRDQPRRHQQLQCRFGRSRGWMLGEYPVRVREKVFWRK